MRMRVRAALLAVVFCHAAASTRTGSHAFILIRSSRWTATTGTLTSGRQPDHVHTLEGPLLDLRGGETVASKKSATGSKGKSKVASKASKSSGTSKSSSSKKRKPSLKQTVKAFFASLVNPHFTLKLKAKQENQVHTVHGSASTVGAS
ncbi:unnamed protein product [Ascophyllum nodosum]